MKKRFGKGKWVIKMEKYSVKTILLFLFGFTFDD